MNRSARYLPLVAVIAACSWSPTPPAIEEPVVAPVATLADLQPALLPDRNRSLPSVDVDTLIAAYQEVLAVTDEPMLRLQVEHRLAGLTMKKAENSLDQQPALAAGQFELAIAAYQSLLKKHPDDPANDRLLYQMSKAYDLEGKIDRSMSVLDELVARYPKSVHYGEAQFRRAELFFSRRDYPRAEQAYREVIKQGEFNVHYVNALYMHGWSLFKQERFKASLKSFSDVLDATLPRDDQLASLEKSALAGLETGTKGLVQDTLRIMSVAFSYLDSSETIVELYSQLGPRPYIPLLYENLGRLYLEKQRYRDSAETYRAFVDRYPESDLAPQFYARRIDAFVAGGFPDDVLTEKERFVQLYGVYSEFWQQKGSDVLDVVRKQLLQYLPELARHYHARAQESDVRPAGRRNSATGLSEPTRAKYLKAGDYYQQFTETFWAEEQLPEIYFLLGESRFAVGSYDRAIDAYEVVAYRYKNDERGATAGYAAIVAYGLLLQSMQGEEQAETLGETLAEERDKWLRLKINSQLHFAQVYYNDPRSAAVLAKSAEELLGLGEYLHAAEAARQLVKREPPADSQLRKTAWLVIGHSEFEMQNYREAESAYHQALKLLAESDAARPDLIERLAASIYKQGEVARLAGDLTFAAEQFLRVEQQAPSSSIAVTARFDAATTLMEARAWPVAIDELNRFRADYPNHKLSATIPAKLVVAYQQTEQWGKAADELTVIYNSADDPELKREALYQAAELYQQAGDLQRAILRYRSYAHAYPEPFGVAMEARYILSELYVETGQPEKRRFWLRKMIEADSKAGAQRTERSRYLAAMSSNVLADDAYQSFAAIKLSLPLKSSLKKKKQALKTVLTRYQQVVDYGVAEFATLATYRIGEVYRQLSRDLMDSQRPANLDALALEQYELLLEEQAYPFEEKSIGIHEANIQRSWSGIYDSWVKASFEALKNLLPARYGKEERGGQFSDDIY